MKIFFYDDYAVNFLRQWKGIRLNMIPDPLLSSGMTRTAAGISLKQHKAICFGCLGALDHRKGVDMLVDAFVNANLSVESSLLLAGQITDKTILAKVEAAQVRLGKNRIIHLNEYLKNQDYFDALKKMDIVCLPYRGHVGASGVFAQSASTNKILIVPDYGWLGWHGKKYNKCHLFKEGKLEDLVRAMEEAEKSYGSLNRIKGDYCPESPERFSKMLCGF